MIIDSFKGRYSFLSNMHCFGLIVNGKKFDSVEHAYQACKTLNPLQQEMIRIAATPYVAKKLGKKVTLRADWNSCKLRVMRKLLALKFAPNTELASLLIDTGSAVLIEGNTWHDRYWGVCDGTGLNHLGVTLMEIRNTLTGK